MNKIGKIGEGGEKINIIPNFGNLKRALIGKNGYLFLVNDTNDEIRQHFDYTYNNNFNRDLFIKFLNYKKKFSENLNIKYYFFLTPDKSLVCKDFLPFDIKMIKRNYNSIKDLVPDFAEHLDHTCYFKTDSHINYLGGKELSYRYLNYIDKNFRRKDLEKLINEQIQTIHNAERPGDLISERNWSYSNIKKEKYNNEKVVVFRNNSLIDLKENLPEKFKFDGERETEYYKNEHGFTNLRVLIFRDSMSKLIQDILSLYFKEILLHWDHWAFPEKLIEWYKPDIILEIRAEKFLENMRYEKITKYETESPNGRNKMKFNIESYDFVDFGCNEGTSIDYAINRFKAKRGIGIDIDPEAVKKAKESGYEAILGDITKMPKMQKSVKFVTMIHFLEHLEGFSIAEKCINSAVDIAQDFVYIKQPFFDSDSYLFKKGFKNYWADHHLHTFHMTSFDFYRILMALQLQSKITRFVIFSEISTVTSDDPHIHPINSKIDQHQYNSKEHPSKKNNVIFNDVFKELEVFIAIKDEKLINDYFLKSTSGERKLIFDSTGRVPLIQNENVKTPDSGIVGEITAGNEISQNIIIPEDLSINNKLYVEILMATFSRENNGKIDIYLTQNNLSDKLRINMREIKDNEYLKIMFDKSPFKAGPATITIKGVDGIKNNAVTAYLTNDAPWGGALVNGRQLRESLVLKIYSFE